VTSTDEGDRTEIVIRVTPLPPREKLVAIISILRMRRRWAAEDVFVTPSRPVSEWGRAGRQEAISARELIRDRDD
jgi:hypothetical protein